MREQGWHPFRLRAGRSVGRTLYQIMPDGSERLVGVMDSPALAALVVDAVHAADVQVAQDHDVLRERGA